MSSPFCLRETAVDESIGDRLEPLGASAGRRLMRCPCTSSRIRGTLSYWPLASANLKAPCFSPCALHLLQHHVSRRDKRRREVDTYQLVRDCKWSRISPLRWSPHFRLRSTPSQTPSTLGAPFILASPTMRRHVSGRSRDPKIRVTRPCEDRGTDRRSRCRPGKRATTRSQSCGGSLDKKDDGRRKELAGTLVDWC